MEFYLPSSTGEWLAWLSAAITVVMGVIMLFAPGLTMRLLRLQPINGRPEAYASVRGPMAGFHLGVGLGCLIFAQPFLWVVLGVAWGFTAFGRFISMMSDKTAHFGSGIYNTVAVIIEIALAGGPLLYAFGLIA